MKSRSEQNEIWNHGHASFLQTKENLEEYVVVVLRLSLQPGRGSLGGAAAALGRRGGGRGGGGGGRLAADAAVGGSNQALEGTFSPDARSR